MAAGLLVAGAADAQHVPFGRNRVAVGETAAWVYVQTPRYDVYAPRGHEALARDAAAEAERVTPRLERLTAHRLERRVPILVFPSAASFAATNAVPLPEDVEGIGGVTDRAKNRVLVPFLGDRGAFHRVLAHELTHAYLNDLYGRRALLRPTRPRMPPLWFVEGLAEYVAAERTQGRPSAADERPLRAALLAGGFPPLDRLRGLFAYRGGHALWAFVADEYGEQRVAELVQAFAATRNLDVSVRAVTGLTVAELTARWQAAWQDALVPEAAFRVRLSEMGRVVPLDAGPADALAPAISPDGNRIAVALLGRYDASVAVFQLADGARLWSALGTRASAAVTRLRLGGGGMAWSPDGRRLAVAASDDRGDLVVLLDGSTGATVRTYRPRVAGRRLDAVLALAWSPDGTALALSAVARGQSDLVRLDIGTGETTALTDDAASDLTPSWTPDGAALVFVSDRGGPATDDGRQTRDDGRRTMDDASLSTSNQRPTTNDPQPSPRRAPAPFQHDLYRLDLAERRLTRLTDTAADESAPTALPGGGVLFTSDASGIANLYRLDGMEGEGGAAGVPVALTDLLVGIDGAVALSPDGSRALAPGLDGGWPTLVLLRTPLALPAAAPAPTLAVGGARAPIYAASTRERRALNPFLRAAAPVATVPPDSAPRDSTGGPPDFGAPTLPDPSAFDTTGLGALLAAVAAEGPEPYRYDAARARDADGQLTARPYRLLFSADALGGTAGLDALYGVQAVAQLRASDLLGNHVFTAASNLLLDLRNSDYSLGYAYRPRPVDVSAQIFHTARLVPESDDAARLTRYRYYGASIGASVPFDGLRRVDASLTLAAVSQASVFEPAQRPVSRRLLLPSVTFTLDRAIDGVATAIGGERAAITATASPVGDARFVSVVGDARLYRSTAREALVFALRGAAGGSFGRRPQRFYGAGVVGWLDPSFAADAFPIVQLEDFAFATPVLPLRGYRLGARSGTAYALVNAEARLPRVALIGAPSGPVLPLQGVLFADIAAFSGPGNGRFRVLTSGGPGAPRRLDDVLVGVGGGLRTSVLGLPVRADIGWPFDGAVVGSPLLYLSLGAEF